MDLAVFERILIATDGSELAGRALAQGLALARALDATVTILTVTEMIETGPYKPFPWPDIVERYEVAAAHSAERILGKAADAAATAGVKYKVVHIADEHPAKGILQACDANACDLIVMASHGRRGLQRWLLGSQTAEVLTLAKVPVLICR